MSDWKPIESAPKDVEAIFWIRPGGPEDGPWWCDTSGNPIVAKDCKPRRHVGLYGSWSSLMIGTHWHPLPAPPQGDSRE